MELGKILTAPLKVSSTAMDHMRETIHENEVLNQIAHRVRSYSIQFFLSQEHLTV